MEGATVGFTYRVVEEFINEYKTIDILVNNAAVQYYTYSIDDITEARLENTFRTNIFAYIFMSKYSLKHMQRGGSLLDYSATKGAIVTFTRSLAMLLVERGIRVNGVAPGPIWTPLQVASLPDRAAQPCEVAPSYVFLASQDFSSYFTGQVLHPNGTLYVVFLAIYN
ncbi:NADPH-dependent aldehyde reductase 1, chloroplastic [Linum perenne]